MHIQTPEYQTRMTHLQEKLKQQDLAAFLISSQESIFYLTGISYEPLERPFFILVRPDSNAILLVPALEKVHLAEAPHVETVLHYWDYPSPEGIGWPEKLQETLSGISCLGVEPSLSQEVAVTLTAFSPRMLPLVEELRLVKSPAEIKMIRRAAYYADKAVEKVIAASYYGVSEIELFSQGRQVQIQIMKAPGWQRGVRIHWKPIWSSVTNRVSICLAWVVSDTRTQFWSHMMAMKT
jgi:Xaa-Pro aminopeptidase